LIDNGRSAVDSTERLFPIQAYDYKTGICSDGRQVVIGLLCPHLVAYFFDPQGNLLRREQRLWKNPAPKLRGEGPYSIYDHDFREALEQQEREWLTELGFSPGTIWIKEFLDGTPVGIEQLPDHFQDVDDLDDEERKSLATWIAVGNFVWWWARDYYMSKDGKVEST